MTDSFTRSILVTGGAGFIGSHVVRRFLHNYPSYKIVNLDKLTYAGNLENLSDVENFNNYVFIKGDITDSKVVEKVFEDHRCDMVIHLAAESHVDRSIIDPSAFLNTNIIGTMVLLNASKKFWKDSFDNKLFFHISTDEVYGSLGEEGFFTEETSYDPRSPYSASKAGSDHLVRAYHHTYGLPIAITNCSNNYGPNQFPEKLIPLCIHNIKNNKPIPVYGNGLNVRDWLFVEDHAAAIDSVLHNGKPGETYNVGGHNEWTNIDLIKLLCKIMDKKLDRTEGSSEQLITFVKDRAGHDMRYAIDAGKIGRHLNWTPSIDFPTGLEKTVEWYLANNEWLDRVTSGVYQSYYESQYVKR